MWRHSKPLFFQRDINEFLGCCWSLRTEEKTQQNWKTLTNTRTLRGGRRLMWSFFSCMFRCLAPSSLGRRWIFSSKNSDSCSSLRSRSCLWWLDICVWFLFSLVKWMLAGCSDDDSGSVPCDATVMRNKIFVVKFFLGFFSRMTQKCNFLGCSWGPGWMTQDGKTIICGWVGFGRFEGAQIEFKLCVACDCIWGFYCDGLCRWHWGNLKIFLVTVMVRF